MANNNGFFCILSVTVACDSITGAGFWKENFHQNVVDVKEISIVLSLLRDTHPVVRDDGEAQGKGLWGQNKDSFGQKSHKMLY